MKNPIIQRELLGTLRTRKALVLLVSVALVFSLLVLARWPTDSRVDLSGAQSQQVFRLFGYGFLATLVLLVPAFPATSFVQEKNRGTLELLLNSPMRSWSIYFGKLFGVLGFAFLLLAMSLPAAAACFAMGGVSLGGHLLVLYAVLLLVTVQYAVLALLVSSYANSTDSALRITYGLVLLASVVSVGPHRFLQGKEGIYALAAFWLRCVSPLPAVMEILGHGDVGTQGLILTAGAPGRYCLGALASIVLMIGWTIGRLNHAMLDRSRAQGVITDERSIVGRVFRWLAFVVDPQRRKSPIRRFSNPVMVKEFRSRRFGRLHWMLRLAALCAVVSLGLTYAATVGTFDWGPRTIGGIMVMLQVALIVLLTPSLAGGLISSERESGNWQLLQMTPMSAMRILFGKLVSVAVPLGLILFATLPGYLVMTLIQPELWGQISRVLVCLLLTAVFALALSAAVSSLCRRTAVATTIAYALLVLICAGTMLVWLGRDAPFGHSTVQAALLINPMAAALSLAEMPGFAQYNLVPANWWITGYLSLFLLLVLVGQTWRLTRPE